MAERSDGADETDEYSETSKGAYATPRTTAPQSPYSTRDVAIGLVVLTVGLAVTVGVPLVLA